MKWTVSPHADFRIELRSGRKVIGTVMRINPRKTKSGYRYSYQAVKRWGCSGGMPGTFGPVFKTLIAAKSEVEAGVAK